jgi:hypothetical protein
VSKKQSNEIIKILGLGAGNYFFHTVVISAYFALVAISKQPTFVSHWSLVGDRGSFILAGSLNCGQTGS